MSIEFKREDRYIVFKLSDLGNSLKGDEIRRLAREYAEQRSLKGKPPLECIVVESDWPEYEPTWKAIEARVTGIQPAPSALAQVRETTRTQADGEATRGMQDVLMKFDPATGEERPYPSHATQWRNWHGTVAWLFDPWTGGRRNAHDVGSDVYGLLIVPTGTLGMDMGGGRAGAKP